MKLKKNTNLKRLFGAPDVWGNASLAFAREAKAAGVEKGSGTAGRSAPIAVSRDKVREIAEQKMRDLNAKDIEAAMRIIEGTARSMGMVVQD